METLASRFLNRVPEWSGRTALSNTPEEVTFGQWLDASRRMAMQLRALGYERENIGLIEAMGLAVLPGRLASELDDVARALSSGAELPETLAAHQPMLDELRRVHPTGLGPRQALAAAREAAGSFFVRGLEHCGVYGADPVAGCRRLLGSLGWIPECPAPGD